MAKRIVIHAGFHKTGTTTIQHALRANRALLKPYLRPVLKHPLNDALHSSRKYSTIPNPISLVKFRRRFRDALTEIGDTHNRCLLVSAEELAGHLPGRTRTHTYSAAAPLARQMSNVVHGLMPDVDLIFVYTTRAPDTWLPSAYWQHVRASSLTMDENHYLQRFQASAQLGDMVREIAKHVPDRVVDSPLEDTADLPRRPGDAFAGLV